MSCYRLHVICNREERRFSRTRDASEIVEAIRFRREPRTRTPHPDVCNLSWTSRLCRKPDDTCPPNARRQGPCARVQASAGVHVPQETLSPLNKQSRPH